MNGEESSAHRINRIALRWRNELKALAETWLSRGAGSFALICCQNQPQDQILFIQPIKSMVPDPWALQLPLPKSIFSDIILCVENVPLDEVETWTEGLRATAYIIAQFFVNEYELDVLTNEVVNYQDLVLGLYELSNALSRHHDLPNMLCAFVEETVRLTNAMSGFAILYSPNRLVEQVNMALPEATLEAQIAILAPVEYAGSVVMETGDSLLCLPIRAAGNVHKVEGVLGLVTQSPLPSPQIKLAKAVTQQAETHLQNIIFYEQRLQQTRLQTELELARSVQMSLLPRHPARLSGMDIAGAAQPALDVGGDFFDYIGAADESITFVLGDVSGKGLSAALVMTMTRTALRGAIALVPSPRAILEMVNRQLYEDMTELDKFTTVFIGRCAPNGDHLSFANAGHAPVVYALPTQSAILLEADAPPLGVLTDFYGEEQSIAMPPGAVLVVCTDGFVEAENELGEMFGYQQLLELVDLVKDQTAEQIMNRLYAEVALFRKDIPQGDDQTIIVIKTAELPTAIPLTRKN